MSRPPSHSTVTLSRPPRDTAPLERRKVVILCVLLVLGVVLLYHRVGRYGFVEWDDNAYVTENEVVRQGLTKAGWRYAWRIVHPGDGGHESKPHGANWHPLTTLSHMLDCKLFARKSGGQYAGGHHLVNVVLHASSAVVLLLAFWRMTGNLWPPVAVAALFAVHPMHVESVAWIAERKDVLSGLFWMLTLLAYAHYASSAPNVGRYLLVVLCFSLGLLAKPMLVTLPAVLLLLDYWPLRRIGSRSTKAGEDVSVRPLRWLIIEKLPLVALAGGVAVITMITQGQLQAVASWEQLPLSARLVNGLTSYAGYLVRLIWPMRLAAFYPHPLLVDSDRLPQLIPWAAGAAILLAAITAVAIKRRRSQPYLLVGWLWFLGTLVPVLGIVQVGSQAMANRYVYIPYIGLYLAMAWTLRDIIAARPAWRTGACVGTGAVLVVAIGLSYRQIGYWESTLALFQHDLEVTQDNWLAHHRLGQEFDRQSETSTQNRASLLQAAVDHYTAGLNIAPGNAAMRHSLGLVFLRQGGLLPPDRIMEQQQKAAAAREQFELADRLKPDDPLIQVARGQALEALGDLEGAIAAYRQALRLEPEMVPALNGLAVIYARQNRIAEAIEQLQLAVQYDPRYAAGHNNLGQMLEFQGQLAAAERHYRQALNIQPEYDKARRNLHRVRQKLSKVDQDGWRSTP